MIPVVLVPAKDPSRAKRRLSCRLNHDQRTALARAMWTDLANALKDISCPVAVVTDSAEVRSNAHSLGWCVLDDTQCISESHAVDHASRALEGDGFDAVLRLPADVPLTRRQDVEVLLAAPPSAPFARLVPSRSRTGTNAVLRSPPSLFPSRFGTDSLVLHIQECRRAGIEPEILNMPNLALDIDEPEDLEALLHAGTGTATHHWLCTAGVDFGLEESRRG